MFSLSILKGVAFLWVGWVLHTYHFYPSTL